MRNTRRMSSVIGAAAAMVLALAAGELSAQSIQELEKQVRDNPAAIKSHEALAEAYLRDCQLEKSLRAWQEILKLQPDHARAKLVVGRLTAQALDLDSQLETLGTLIDKGVFKGTGTLLDAAAQRAATDTQKAHILYLRGRLALRDRQEAAPGPTADTQELDEEEEPAEGASQPAKARSGPLRPRMPLPPPEPPVDASQEASARSFFEGAMKLAPDSLWAARSALALARLEAYAGRRDAARGLLRRVTDNPKLDDPAVKQIARFRLVMLDAQDLTPPERMAAIQEVLGATTAAPARRLILDELVATANAARGRWGPEAVDYLGLMLAISPEYEQAAPTLGRLAEVAATSQDAATLDRLLAVLKGFKADDPAAAHQVQFLLVEALLARAVVEDKVDAVSAAAAEAHRLLDALSGDKSEYADRARAGELRGRCYLVEAQKRIALEGAAAALPLLVKAKDHYLAMLPARPEPCLDRLANIAALLEHVKEWEMAAALYREVATRFPHLAQGRDALLKVARLHERSLSDPLAALAVYAEYSSRYPADLPYRQLELGHRLRRLGYASLLDFQKRHGLAADGQMGPKTTARLEEVEQTFDQIGAVQGEAAGPLRGQFVHPEIFRIAHELEKAGRARDAIAAYRLFVNLFPTKKQADESLLSVARLLRDNLLFEEALGAYAELMEDFPKGDMTSEAYVESAGCLENLGRWKEARDVYELYVKKFPQYKHVALCKERMALLDEIRQYQEFVTGNPQSPKAAEAQYQLATILYEKFKNYNKAAVEFQKVAQGYPRHVRAADGLYTAGAALLKADNFQAARASFGQVVRDYRDSRLADDAQFWIGHTYEYAARALGKLDEQRIVLKRRSLGERQQLLADLELRRTYYAKLQAGSQAAATAAASRDAQPPSGAAAAPALPEEIWGGDALGVLTSGSARDRVNADLFRAIQAYRKVVDEFKTGDMAGQALLRIGTIYTQYLKYPDKGIKAYQELLAHYGSTKEAVDALYEVGAYYLKEGNYDEAIKAYQEFIYNHPNQERAEDAMLAVARCHAEKKAWDKALDAYQSYLNKYPTGKGAEFAKAQITWIRMYHF